MKWVCLFCLPIPYKGSAKLKLKLHKHKTDFNLHRSHFVVEKVLYEFLSDFEACSDITAKQKQTLWMKRKTTKYQITQQCGLLCLLSEKATREPDELSLQITNSYNSFNLVN